MSKIIGLDIGDKRVGIAIGETETRLVSPRKTVLRAKGAAEEEIGSIIEKEQISLAVVGLPLNIRGEKTPQSERVLNFCRRLSRRRDIQIAFVDEYLTSEEAAGAVDGDRLIAKRSGEIDALSASIILQEYLNSLQKPK